MIVRLCFHGIGTCTSEREPGEARYWISRDRFLRILDAVRDVDHVQLSFDDGNQSDLSIALPAILERELRASFFALAGRLNDPASLSSADLRQLRDAGMVIGSHGWAHRSWRGLDTQQQQQELIDARTALAEASAGPIEEAALPLGQYDRRLLSQLRLQNYRHVSTSDRLPSRPDSWLQPRYSVTADDTVESLQPILSPRRRPIHWKGRIVSVAKRLR